MKQVLLVVFMMAMGFQSAHGEELELLEALEHRVFQIQDESEHLAWKIGFKSFGIFLAVRLDTQTDYQEQVTTETRLWAQAATDAKRTTPTATGDQARVLTFEVRIVDGKVQLEATRFHWPNAWKENGWRPFAWNKSSPLISDPFDPRTDEVITFRSKGTGWFNPVTVQFCNQTLLDQIKRSQTAPGLQAAS